MENNKISVFIKGVKDGIPICLGYFAVGFTLGIAMSNAGLAWPEGFFMSLLNLASAGEYAGIQVILNNGSYFEMAIMTLVANARYLLMSWSLTQKISEETTTKERMLIGYGITDELFVMGINYPGKLDPFYYYGGLAISAPGWAIGTALGIVMGDILPTNILSALSVALYGMFLAAIMPAAKKDKTVLVLVLISFVASFLGEILPLVSSLSSGTRIIIITVVISAIAAIVRPVNKEEQQ